MSKFQHDVMLRVVKILNVLMIELPFAACWFLYYSHQTYANLAWKGHFAILGLFFILYIVLGKIYDAFWMSMQRVSELVYGQILGAMATDGILYIVICLMSAKLCNLLPGIAAIVGQLVMAAIWASCAHKWYYKTFPPQKTAVVYDVRHGMEKLINEYGLSQKYDVQVTLSVSECLADLSILDGMETVFVSGVHSHERNIILKHCVGKGINMFVIPRVGDVIMSGAWPMHMFHLPMLRVGRYMASPEFLFIKRAMDIVISLLALIILSPLLLITAIAVKSDGGPAFYKQVRLTKDGKQFEILKFRSMRVDAEKDGVARLSTGDKDDRITKVGHIIRACRLDELPQLLNILKGDLSVVGPRPERPEIAAQYCEEMPEEILLLVEDYIDGKLHVFDKDWPELPFAHREHIGCTVDYVSGRNRYMGYLISLGVYSFKGVKVGLDCANGSSWNIAKSVFDALGADTYVINNKPNGTNINNNAGSTHIEGLQKFVVEKGLDIGFAYDGDADRCLCVDEKGNVITGDHILYIYGCYMKERGKLLTNTVVTTVMSNFGLYKAFDEKGIGYAKTAVGDKYVYEYMAKNGCRIGGEQSGHIIFSKYASTGDGILTSLKMMEVMLAKKVPMSKLAEPLKIYPQVLENVRVTDKKAAQADEAVQVDVNKVAEALGDTGRILVRESGTEPVVRVMVEAPDHDTCQKYVDEVVETIKSRGYGV
mgnify:CR=1 FL=1